MTLPLQPRMHACTAQATCHRASSFIGPTPLPGQLRLPACSALPVAKQLSSKQQVPHHTVLASQDDKEASSSRSEGPRSSGMPQEGKEQPDEDVRRGLREALLRRGPQGRGSKQGGPQGSGGGGGAGPPGRPSPGRLLAGQAAYTGLVGTLAIGCASALHLNLFSLFHWEDLTNSNNQLLLALALSIPLQAANLTIMGPSWSAWKLPKLAKEEEKLERELAQGESPTSAASSSGSGGSGVSQEGPGSSAPARSEQGTDSSASASSSSTTTRRSSSSEGGSGSGSPSSSGGVREVPLGTFKPPLDGKLPTKADEAKLRVVPASSWGSGGGQGDPGSQPPKPGFSLPTLPSRKSLRDALHLAQGYYVANNATAGLPPLATLGVILGDCAAGELLYRGVVVGGLAGWLRDRAYEGGATELIPVPGPIARIINTSAALASGATPDLTAGGGLIGTVGPGTTTLPGAVSPGSVAESLLPFLHGQGQLVTLDDASRWVAGTLLVAALTSLAANRINKARKRVSVVADLRGRFSEVLAKQRSQQAKEQESKGGAGSSSSSSSEGRSSTDASSSSSSSSNRGEQHGGEKGESRVAASSEPGEKDEVGSQRSTAVNDSVQATTSPSSSNNGSGTPMGADASSSSSRDGSGGESRQQEGGSESSEGSAKGGEGGRPSVREMPRPSAEAVLQLQGVVPPGRVMLAAGGGEGGNNGGGGGGGGKGPGGNGPQVVLDPLAWSTTFQAVRDLLQTMTLVSIFVVSGGNMAASYVASVLNQVIFTILQERCAERAKQRSAVLVQELEQFNEQLRRIAAKRTEQEEAKRKQQGSMADAQQGARESGQRSEREAQGQEQGQGALSAAKLAEPPTSPASTNDVPAGSGGAESAAASPPGPAGAAREQQQQQGEEQGAKAQGSNSAVARTLSLLDAMLPEEKSAKK